MYCKRVSKAKNHLDVSVISVHIEGITILEETIITVLSFISVMSKQLMRVKTARNNVGQDCSATGSIGQETETLPVSITYNNISPPVCNNSTSTSTSCSPNIAKPMIRDSSSQCSS